MLGAPSRNYRRTIKDDERIRKQLRRRRKEEKKRKEKKDPDMMVDRGHVNVRVAMRSGNDISCNVSTYACQPSVLCNRVANFESRVFRKVGQHKLESNPQV